MPDRRSGRMTINATRILLVALLLACPLAAVADDRRGGEVGFVVGGILTDDEMTRDDGATELTVGLRGGSVFTRHIGWYVDGLYSEIDTLRPRGTGRTVIGRSGVPPMDSRASLSRASSSFFSCRCLCRRTVLARFLLAMSPINISRPRWRA